MSLTVAMDVTKSDCFVNSYTSRQGEINDNIYIRLYDDGLPILMNSIEKAKLLAETPHGHYIEIDVPKSNDCIKITTTSAMNNESGQFKRFYLKITLTSGKVVTTPDLIYFVLPDANFTGGNAQDYIDRVEELIEQMTKIITKTLEDFESSLETLDSHADTIASSLNNLTKGVEDLQALMDELVANGAMTKQQADTYYMKAGLPTVTDQDWNEIKTIGSYSVEGATGSNPPKQNAWGTLLVLGKSDSSWQKTQLFVSAIDMWFRRFDGSNWQDWSQAGSNFKAATPEEIIVGERDDVVVTPKGLKEASKQTKLKAYFDAGDYPRNITTTPYFIPFGPILKDNNDELSSPAYVRNSNGSVSFLRDMTIMITINCKILIGGSSPSDHVFISVVVNDNPTPNNIISQGSTGATNGVMRYDWNQMGNCMLSVKAGDFIGISINHIQNEKKVSGVQITTAVIEEI